MAILGKTFFDGDDARCFSSVAAVVSGGSGDTTDSMESYVDLAAVNGLNGGINWNGPYVDSGSTILSRTFSAIEDKRILLSNSQFARPFSLPGWSKLRIAMRLNMRNTGADLADPFFYVGICSGSTNKIMDATTTNWVGVKSNQGSSQWRYWPANPIEYYAPRFRATRRVGSTTTDNNADITNGATWALPADATLEKRVMMFVDISRDTPAPGTYTIDMPIYYSSVPTTVSDVSVADFLTQSVAASPAYSTHTSGVPRTLVVDEAPGVFNHVNIGWDQVTPIIEICDLRVVKLI